MKVWHIAILVFLFAFGIRLWHLNDMGRWGDERGFMEKSWTLTELLRKGDFSNPFWYTKGADHPPLPHYVYGLAGYLDFERYNPQAKPLFTDTPKGAPIFRYDLTYARLISVIVGSLAVLLVFLFGVRYFSLFVGISAAMILSMLPHFVGFSQLVDLESWMVLFFTGCVFAYCLYLETQKTRWLVMTGIVTGLSLEVKQSQILIFLFYPAAFFLYKKLTKDKKLQILHFIPLVLITGITCFVVWPMPFLHSKEFLQASYDLWFKDPGRIPELVFGRMVGAGSYYYILAFFVTTPVLILVLTAIGSKVAVFDKRKQWIYPILFLWFLVPFSQSAFHIRQGMVRYIIEIYAPLALLAGVGLSVVEKVMVKRTKVHNLSLLIIFLYLAGILSQLTPYYFTYYNELVGGRKTVTENKLFFVGWDGEGLRNPGLFLAGVAKRHASVGIATTPVTTLYESPDLSYELYDQNHRYDYVVVNLFHDLRMGFDEKSLLKKYTIVYTEKAGPLDLVHVYKHI